MAWKSREDKLPPPSFFTMIVAHLQEAYRGAHISREMMMTLRPFFIEAWRNGRTAAAAAQTTCSCNGREIIPSPAIGVHIAKGSVRPPKNAQRGDVFGADELRQPPKIERLQHQLNRVVRKEEQQTTVESRWGQRAQTSKSDAGRKEAQRKQSTATTKRADLLDEARRIEDEIARLKREFNRIPTKEISADPIAKKLGPVEHPVLPPVRTPPSPPPTEPTEPAKKRRGRKPNSEKANRSPSTESPPSPDAQSAALLGAVKGLLPGLAKQLAEQMAQEETEKKK